MKVKTYTSKGVAGKEITLPEVFSVEKNDSLIKQTLFVLEDRTHFGLARVKTRSEINRTKKKLYKQKGTGGARHGAKSAHIFVGGGVVHGPTGIKRTLSVSAKMGKKALQLILAKRLVDGSASIVAGLSDVKKTKEAQTIIDAMKATGKTLVVLADTKASRFYSNISDVKVLVFANLNALVVSKTKNVLLDLSIFEKEEKSKEEKPKKKGTK